MFAAMGAQGVTFILLLILVIFLIYLNFSIFTKFQILVKRAPRRKTLTRCQGIVLIILLDSRKDMIKVRKVRKVNFE